LSGQPVPVLKRKAPLFHTAMGPTTFVSVTKSDRPERVTRRTFARDRVDIFWDVTLVTPHTGPEGLLPEHADLRQQFSERFDSDPPPGVPVVFDMQIEPLEYLPVPGQEQQWDYQGVRVTTSFLRVR